MENNILEKIQHLTPIKRQQLEDYLDFLLLKEEKTQEQMKTIAEKRKSAMGSLRNEIWIADDFNNTPQDFKEYI